MTGSPARHRSVAGILDYLRRLGALVGIAARPGWSDIPAVRAGQVHEIKSPIILQPGPAALTDGLQAIAARIRAAV